jgi:hypothetical protein
MNEQTRMKSFKIGSNRWALIMGLKVKVKLIALNRDNSVKCQILGLKDLSYTNVSKTDILPIEGNE